MSQPKLIFHRVDVGIVLTTGACNMVHPAATFGQALHFVEKCLGQLEPGETVRVTPVYSSSADHSASPRRSMAILITKDTDGEQVRKLVSSVFPS